MEPFEIAPAGELRARMLAEMPEGTEHSRVVVATLDGGDGWVAVDPGYFRPDQEIDEIGSAFESSGEVSVALDLLTPPGGRPIVGAVSVLSDLHADVTGTRELEETVAVDFRGVMIAAAGAAQRCWRVGGPGCRANLLHATDLFDKEESTAQQMAAAAAALEAAGIELVEEFGRPAIAGVVTDETIARAEEVLAGVPGDVGLNVSKSSTGAAIDDALAGAPFATLSDGGRVWAVVLDPGFGNGIYYWDELSAGDEVTGHRMSFLN